MKLLGRAGLVVGVGLLVVPVWLLAYALSALLELDGEFQDWQTQTSQADIFGDSHAGRGDIKLLRWGVNPGESNLYFFIERYTKDGLEFDGSNGQTASVSYCFHFLDPDESPHTNAYGHFKAARDDEIESH